MPFGASIGVDWAWTIPALSASAFVLTILFGRFLPRQGALIPVIAIFLGFVPFWYVLRDLLANGPDSFTVNWLTINEPRLTITWGIMVDRLSVTMLAW